MKKLLILILVLAMGVASADVVSPLPNVKTNLESLLKKVDGRKTFNEMKVIANDRNTDVDIAYENYIIAKKNVSIARAQFNPITTGHLLGIALGLNYFWAPLAIDAVLSIPTKIYNVSKNKYLAKSAYYNLGDARSALNNELAHLYYDILTHEVILKTIDEEMSLLSYQESQWLLKKYSPDRMKDIRKMILRLSMGRVDMYNMYTAELAAIRTLISTTDANKYELAQISLELNRSMIINLEEEKLQSFALINSDKYKSSINLHRASEQNIKQVQWSLITASGLNFSYKRRVKEARNEENIADLRMQTTALEVKTNVLLQLSKFGSSLDVFDNYNSLSKESFQMYVDTYEANMMGTIGEDETIQTALGAIHDFRSKVVAHYAAWSALSDFSTSANFDFQMNSDQSKSSLNQVELNPLYGLEENDYKVVKKDLHTNVVSVSLSSPKTGSVANVDYILDNDYGSRSSDNGKRNYSVLFTGENLPKIISGVAIVRLDNGHEFKLKFKL